MPGDIIGANLFNFQTSSFTLTRGPVFTDLLLADEINRTPPKTQAALLEAMQERTVTIDGETLPLGPRFTVVATQNPIEQQGVYPLPEAQLDRFLFKVDRRLSFRRRRSAVSSPPTARSGEAMAPETWGVEGPRRRPADRRGGEGGRARVQAGRRGGRLHRRPGPRDARPSRPAERRVSPRAGAMLAGAARARAAIDGRDFVIPDDVKALAPGAAAPPPDPVARRRDRGPGRGGPSSPGIIEQIEAPR